MGYPCNRSLALALSHFLVEAHFPGTLQGEVLRAAGIEAAPWELNEATLEFARSQPTGIWDHSKRRRRDPAFARRVLEAYKQRCAICEFAIRLEDRPVALEAAHIKWHKARGPDEVRNGLALCTLHHRLFDRGAFTLSTDRVILVARSVQGPGHDDALGRYEKHQAAAPTSTIDKPDPEFLGWHHRQVFKDDPRLLAG